MSTFYDAPNDYRNYLCHYGVPNMKRPHGLKYKKRGTSLRAHRLEQVRKSISGREMTEDQHEREDQRRRDETSAERDRQHRINENDSNHSANRNAQTIADIEARRQEKIRREQELQAERERNRKRDIEPSGLSAIKETHRARNNGYKLHKLYNTRKPGNRRH